MSRDSEIRVGTSGWSYVHWKGPFYPKDLSSTRFLDFYIHEFQTVEYNRTFYQLPEPKVFTNYAKKVPAHFLFSIKASRYITHIKRLKATKLALNRFFSRVKKLGSHLGPILFQLPPSWNVNVERLKEFIPTLPKGYRYAFEFRNETWIVDEVLDLLREHNIAFCIYELGTQKTDRIITADFIYVRLHGPKKAYSGKYSLPALKKWAAFFKQEKKDVYCYFDNDEKGYAAENAKQLLLLLEGDSLCM